MSTQEFASNNPFRSISISVTSSSKERHNPFLDCKEYRRNIPHTSTMISSESRSPHATLRTVSQWEHKPSYHLKHEVKTAVSCHECVRGNSDDNASDPYKNIHRNYKYSPFTKEKEYEKNILKDNFKEKSKNSVRSKGRFRTHVDRIDLLDVTAVYGSGAFHHDGPFDACNPYRNKSFLKDPVLAFHKDSTSMSFLKEDTTESLGFPIDKYFGHRDIEAYNEFSPSAFYSRNHSSSLLKGFTFELPQKTELLHGSEMSNFDVSTSLEGIYVSQSVTQPVSLISNEDEKKNRKHNLAQRIHNIKKNSQSNDLSTHSMIMSSSSETTKQIDLQKGIFSNKKKNSISQSGFPTMSSENSESCNSKGLFSRVRSLKAANSRNNRSEN